MGWANPAGYRGIVRLSDAHWASVQYVGHGTRRLQVPRLLAHGPAAGDTYHCHRHPHAVVGLATLRGGGILCWRLQVLLVIVLV